MQETIFVNIDPASFPKQQNQNIIKALILILSILSAVLIISAGAMIVAAGVQAGAQSGAQAGADVSHATMKHGSDAMLARQCMNGENHFYLFHNPQTDRYGMVCQIDGSWGVVITDQAGNEITAFLKDKMTRFDQVFQYMRNAGYDLVH